MSKGYCGTCSAMGTLEDDLFIDEDGKSLICRDCYDYKFGISEYPYDPEN